MDFQPREKRGTLPSLTGPAFCHMLPGLTALLLREEPTTVFGERRVSALAMGPRNSKSKKAESAPGRLLAYVRVTDTSCSPSGPG